MKKKKEKFTVKIDSKDVDLAVLVPTIEMMSKARIEQSLAFTSAMNGRAPLRAKLDKYVREQGIWDDDKQREVEAIALTVNDGESRLSKGGIPLVDAKQIALDIRQARSKINELMSDRNALDAYTCEGQSENARFNSLVSQSIIYNDSGKPYFSDLNDYLENSDSNVAVEAATIFARLYYGIDDDYYQQLPENQFLLRYKFCNKDLKLIDKQGRLVDEFGSLIDENGFLVNEGGSHVNYSGDEIDKEGRVLAQALPFTNNDGDELDGDGNVVDINPTSTLPANPKKSVAKTTKKTTKKKTVKKTVS